MTRSDVALVVLVTTTLIGLMVLSAVLGARLAP